MSLDIDKLEELAKAATPGPWGQEDGSVFSHEIGDQYGYQIAVCKHECSDFPKEEIQNNAAYIVAANPAVVLELIGRLRAADALAAARITNLEPKAGDLLVVTLHADADHEQAQRVLDTINSVVPSGVGIAATSGDLCVIHFAEVQMLALGWVKATPADKKREAFEAWAKQQDYFAYPVDKREYGEDELLERDGDGYADALVHSAWMAWQVAR